jgi:uncharacterized RDD family membrane protein YckC
MRSPLELSRDLIGATSRLATTISKAPGTHIGVIAGTSAAGVEWWGGPWTIASAMEFNPYQPPVAETAEPLVIRAPRLYPASAGQRFLNLAIDYVAATVLSTIVVGVLMLAFGEDFLDQIPDSLYGVAVLSTYYMLFEGLMGRTLGKLVTRTRVVSADGKGLSFGRLFVRTISRFVPFEAFSIWFGDGEMWHDSWSQTTVMTTRAPRYITEAEK